MSLSFSGRSDVGRVRSNNEDAFLVRELEADLLLAVVCDGVGGNKAGEVASGMAVAEFERLADVGKLAAARDARVRAPLLEMATQKVHVAISEASLADPDRSGMAATLTAVVLDASAGTLCQVGDSRCYRLRDGTLEQLSTDQTIARELLEAGRISEAHFATHPDRNTLSQCLGLEAVDAPLAPVLTNFDCRPGDRFLLCSDGLSDLVDDEAIRALLAAHGDDADAVEALVDAALEAGGRDNVTVVVVSVDA